MGVRGVGGRPGRARGGDPRPGRRVRVRQDHDLARDHEPAPARARHHPGLRRRRRRASRAGRRARPAPSAADGVPGPGGVAEPSADGLRHPRRAAARTRHGRSRHDQATGRGPDGAGRARPWAQRPLPECVLRRRTAAARHRPRTGHQPVTGGPGRAGVRVGRLDPGRRDQSVERAQGRAGAVVPVRGARPGGGAVHRRPGRRDVPGPDRGDRRRGRGVRRPPAPLHRSPALGDAGARPARGTLPHARAAARRPAQPDRLLPRLPIRQPVPPAPLPSTPRSRTAAGPRCRR